MKQNLPYFRIFAFAICVALLTACGGANEDQDVQTNPVDERIALTGLALNGYVANALVWVDSRTNNTLDGFEAYAYTDAQGYISYNPTTGVNYCDASDESLQRFCLKTSTQTGKLVIKAAKGVELLSGESFKSVLSTTVQAQDVKTNLQNLMALGTKPSGNSSAWQADVDALQFKLSPLSSLKYYLPESTSLASVLLNLGYNIPDYLSDEALISKEYIAGLNENEALAASLFAASVTLGRLVDVVVSNLDTATTSVDFGESGLPISTADSVYEALAESLVDSASTAQIKPKQLNYTAKQTNNEAPSDIFPSNDLIVKSIAKLKTLLEQHNQTSTSVQNQINIVEASTHLPSLLSSIGNTSVRHFNVPDFSTQMTEDMLSFNQTVTLPTLTPAISFLRQQQADAITTLSTFMQAPENQVTTVLKSITSDFLATRTSSDSLTLNLDLNSLSQNLLSVAEQSDAEDQLASQDISIQFVELAQVTTPSNNSFWAGKSLSLSGVQDGSEQGQVLIYFNGDDTSTSGNIVMCVAYQNDNDPSDNIDGQRFEGTWALIGSASQNRLSLVSEGFNIQMKVLGESLGFIIPVDQQVPNLPRMPNESYGRFGFTLNEDSATWYSDHASINQDYGLRYFSDIPSNSQACQDILSL